MQIKCYDSEYKGIPAVVLENEKLRAMWLPSYGSKLASLVIKSDAGEHELLFQSDLETLNVPTYGATFSDFESSGYDECFPTIDACEFEGKEMPDHGEVWALPWQWQNHADGSLTFCVYSHKFQYTLSKTVSITHHGIVSQYHVSLSPDASPLPFIWTPHALFNASIHTKIFVPERMNSIYNVCDGYGRLGKYGDISSYPIPVDKPALDLRYLEPKLANNCEKYYFTQALKNNDVFGFSDDHARISMHVDHDIVPHLAIWKNQGTYKGHYNFALEPCTGIYDNTSSAYKNGTCQLLTSNAAIEWRFDIYIEA